VRHFWAAAWYTLLVHTQVTLEMLVHPPGADEIAFERHPATHGGMPVFIGGEALLVIVPLEDHALTVSAATETKARSLKLPIIL